MKPLYIMLPCQVFQLTAMPVPYCSIQAMAALVDTNVAVSSSRSLTPAHLVRTLFEVRGPSIYAAIFRIVADREVAEELVFEAFWGALETPHVMRLGPEGIAVWLQLRGRSLAIESLRSRDKTVSHTAEFRAEFRNAAELLPEISIALLRLPPHQREAFELAYFEGLSHSQIAQITGRSLGTVKTWVRSSRLRVVRSTKSNQIRNLN